MEEAILQKRPRQLYLGKLAGRSTLSSLSSVQAWPVLPLLVQVCTFKIATNIGGKGEDIIGTGVYEMLNVLNSVSGEEDRSSYFVNDCGQS